MIARNEVATTMKSSLRGRRVFLTGGSSGIGAELARLLVEQGSQVFLVARNVERLTRFAHTLEKSATECGGAVHFSPLDISRRQDIPAAVDEALDAMGGIDTLINNAGISYVAPFLETPQAEFDKVIAINYLGTIDVTRVCLPSLLEADDGMLITVCSLGGLIPVFGYTGYGSTKFAIAGFMGCLRQELLGSNVTISVAFPGDTETPLLVYENEMKPPETHALAGTVRPMAADIVARKILEGAQRGVFEVFVDSESKMAYRLMRYMPRMARWYMDRIVRGAQR
jgi:3-dehydrosphinganine reductase